MGGRPSDGCVQVGRKLVEGGEVELSGKGGGKM